MNEFINAVVFMKSLFTIKKSAKMPKKLMAFLISKNRDMVFTEAPEKIRFAGYLG